MATVLVTVVGPQRRTDLALPADSPIVELLPEIVELCVDRAARTSSARWAVGRLGAEPFAPTRTLSDASVVDGMILYVRDMTSQGPPPPGPTRPPVGRPPALAHPAAASPSSAGSSPGSSVATGGREVARDGVGRPIAPQRAGAGPAINKAYELTGTGLVVAGAGLFVVATAVLVFGTGRGMAGTAFLFDVLLLAAAGYGVWNYGIVATTGRRYNIRWMRKLRLPPRLAKHAPETSSDPWKEERLGRLTTLAEDFIYDLGRLLAGEKPPLDYVTDKVAAQLRAMAAPFLRTGDRMVPNFSDVQLTVQWPSDHQRAIGATAVFSDQSKRQTAGGETVTPPPKRVTIQLQTDAEASRIVNAQVSSTDGRLL